MFGEQTAVTTLNFGSDKPTVKIRLTVYFRTPAEDPDDPEGLGHVMSRLCYEPPLYESNWQLQDMIHRHLHNAIREGLGHFERRYHDGLGFFDHSSHDGGIYTELRELSILPSLPDDLSDSDVQRVGWILNRMIMGIVVGLDAGLEGFRPLIE